MKRLKKPLPFNSTLLRQWATQIQKAKDDIEAALTAPMEGRTQFNLAKWNRMNSQEKKLFVFKSMEMGLITYSIEARK
jgi:hypothetical protein